MSFRSAALLCFERCDKAEPYPTCAPPLCNLCRGWKIWLMSLLHPQLSSDEGQTLAFDLLGATGQLSFSWCWPDMPDGWRLVHAPSVVSHFCHRLILGFPPSICPSICLSATPRICLFEAKQVKFMDSGNRLLRLSKTMCPWRLMIAGLCCLKTGQEPCLLMNKDITMVDQSNNSLLPKHKVQLRLKEMSAVFHVIAHTQNKKQILTW